MLVKAEIIDQGPLTEHEAEIAKLMADGYADRILPNCWRSVLRRLIRYVEYLSEVAGAF